MRKSTFIFLIVGLILSATASAQFLGQMAPAPVWPTGHSNIGSYVIIADGATGVVGSYRYGFSDFIEGRARLGFIDPDGGDMSIILGGDMKYQLWQYKVNKNPLDLSLGGGFEYSKAGNAKLLSLHGSVIGSIPLQLKNNRSLEPYSRLSLRMQRVSVDEVVVAGQSYGGGSDTKLKIGLSLGAVFRVIDLADFTAEIQIDDNTAFMLGVDLFQF